MGIIALRNISRLPAEEMSNELIICGFYNGEEFNTGPRITSNERNQKPYKQWHNGCIGIKIWRSIRSKSSLSTEVVKYETTKSLGQSRYEF